MRTVDTDTKCSNFSIYINISYSASFNFWPTIKPLKYLFIFIFFINERSSSPLVWK